MPPVRRSQRQQARPSKGDKKEEGKGEKPGKGKASRKSKAAQPTAKTETGSRTQGTRMVAMSAFPYTLPYKRLDLRAEPHLYRPGKGEQGVLMVEPYKSELLPFWSFKNPEAAQRSSHDLRLRFDRYLAQEDFVGADMARKFIQMGFTRTRRYANHRGGRKYAVNDDGTRGAQLPRSSVDDPIKAESARIFKDVLEEIKVDERYARLRTQFEQRYADMPIPVYADERQPTK